MTAKERLYKKVKAYCESEYLRLIVLIEPPDLNLGNLEPIERYIKALRQRTERAVMLEQLRILPKILDWVKGF